MTTERREAYRSRFDVPDGLILGIVDCDRRVPATCIADASLKGIGLVFMNSGLGDVDAGAEVRLWIAWPAATEPVEIDAVCAYRIQGEGGEVRCGFTIVDPEALREQLPEYLLHVFNERAIRRIDVRSAQVEVLMVADDGSASSVGRMCDISTNGISVKLQSLAHGVVKASNRVGLSFRLPTSSAEIHAWAEVRSIRIADDSIVYGLEFAGRDAAAFEHVRSEVDVFLDSALTPA